MGENRLLRTELMDCPLCDRKHAVEERSRTAKTIIKGEEIYYEETYYCCANSEEGEREFVTGKMMNDNLLNARNAYRVAHGLLTSDEIVKIREKYGLSQVDLANLLGWGEATISRYESKAIQDEAYDNMLRIIKDNPLVALEYLEKNINRFAGLKGYAIRQRIVATLDDEGKEYLQRQSLLGMYVNYNEPCDENGNCVLNIDKLEAVISYFASSIPLLYKVKLMKLLWYSDALSFKKRGTSITGLVYAHDTMGALPLGHYEIVGLENVHVSEEEDYDKIIFRFLPNKNIDLDVLSEEEFDILDTVLDRFGDFGSKDIVRYMHREIAYKNTKDKEIIPFKLAEQIRDF